MIFPNTIFQKPALLTMRKEAIGRSSVVRKSVQHLLLGDVLIRWHLQSGELKCRHCLAAYFGAKMCSSAILSIEKKLVFSRITQQNYFNVSFCTA